MWHAGLAQAAALTTCWVSAASAGDHLVGWANASIRDDAQLPKRDPSIKGVGVIREDPLDTAFLPGPLSEQLTNAPGQQVAMPMGTPVARTQLEEPTLQLNESSQEKNGSCAALLHDVRMSPSGSVRTDVQQMAEGSESSDRQAANLGEAIQGATHRDSMQQPAATVSGQAVCLHTVLAAPIDDKAQAFYMGDGLQQKQAQQRWHTRPAGKPVLMLKRQFRIVGCIPRQQTTC